MLYTKMCMSHILNEYDLAFKEPSALASAFMVKISLNKSFNRMPESVAALISDSAGAG